MKLRVCLLEGRYESETQQTTKTFMRGIHKLIKNYVADEGDTYVGSLALWQKINGELFKFTIELYVERGRALESEGLYTPRNNYEDILVKLTIPAARVEYLEGIRVELFDVIRHEIEHAFKEGSEPAQDDGTDALENLRSYLLEPDEVSAWTAGLYKRAKTLKRPFGAVAARELDRISKGRASLLGDVLRAWNDEAQRRFPAAKWPW